eukprot:COSAG01_NODE_4325_length_5131_cov_187.768084_3_plen_205_part_00
MDAQGVEQGPFGLQQMRQWYAAGYFTSELQAKCGRRGELRPFATISEIAVADELTLRPELAATGDWSMGHAAGSGAAATAAAMPSVEQSSAQIAAMQQESLAAAVQQPGAGKDEGRSASGRHPTFGSAPWRAEQVRRPLRPATSRFDWDFPMRRVFLSRNIEGATDAGRSGGTCSSSTRPWCSSRCAAAVPSRIPNSSSMCGLV